MLRIQCLLINFIILLIKAGFSFGNFQAASGRCEHILGFLGGGGLFVFLSQSSIEQIFNPVQ